VDKSELIWMNGELVPWDNANVHVLSHGLHYGTGVFEGIRCYDTPKGPAVFRLTGVNGNVVLRCLQENRRSNREPSNASPPSTDQCSISSEDGRVVNITVGLHWL